ncbi:sensor histidine kinase [Alteromonas gilva]|uniref:Histidine kinase n=1 Tax=Alteromonas gilva TaxID=2987522 RepID=A0ABT5L824_9ALTE|nr:histidine kinase [Alteromonas gilva]MDC8831953.1 histidine kinase [Alteromonas gilva]
MKLSRIPITPEQVGAVVTIIVVALANAWVLAGSERYDLTDILRVLSCFGLFTAMFLLATREQPFQHDLPVRYTLIVAQYLLVLTLFSISPLSFNAILLVIWSALLPYYMPFKKAVWLSPLWSVGPWLVYAYAWQQNGGLWITAILFWTFNLFALVMMESRNQAEQEKQRAEQANRELRALQDLMQQAGRKEERTRIARDIHDLVGHHLTGLSLHLQVASRTVPAAQKPVIDQCLSIARLLLSDVREAVSDMREFGQLDLLQALQALIDPLRDKIQVNIACNTDISGLSLLQATNLLRCIQESLTNSLRHGRADTLDIHIYRASDALIIDITDNGSGSTRFTPGNGLKGMQERMAELNGSATFTCSETGFHAYLSLPEPR